MSIPNGTCATAVNVSVLVPYSATLDTTTAASDPSVTPSCCDNNKAAWYKFTNSADESVRFQISTEGTNYVNAVSFWSGSCGSLVELLCQNTIDGSDRTCIAGITVVAGGTVYALITDDDTDTGGTLEITAIKVTSTQLQNCILANGDTDELFHSVVALNPSGAIVAWEFIERGGQWFIAQRSSDGHIFVFVAAGLVYELDSLLGYVQTFGSPSPSDPDTLFPNTDSSWNGAKAIQFIDSSVWLTWSGSGGQIGKVCIQERDATDFSLTNQYIYNVGTWINGPMGVNQDGSKFFFTVSAPPNDLCKIFQGTTTSGATSLFATYGTPGDYEVLGTSLGLLANGNIVAIFKLRAGTTCKVAIFNSAGALQLDFTVSNSPSSPRYFGITADGLSIWETGTSDESTPDIYRKYLLSDGSLTTSFNSPITSGTNNLLVLPGAAAASCPIRTSDYELIETSDGYLLAVEGECTGNPGSGLYKLVLLKRNDTLYSTPGSDETEDVAIPRPSARTAYLGDEQ